MSGGSIASGVCLFSIITTIRDISYSSVMIIVYYREVGGAAPTISVVMISVV